MVNLNGKRAQFLANFLLQDKCKHYWTKDSLTGQDSVELTSTNQSTHSSNAYSHLWLKILPKVLNNVSSYFFQSVVWTYKSTWFRAITQDKCIFTRRDFFLFLHFVEQLHTIIILLFQNINKILGTVQFSLDEILTWWNQWRYLLFWEYCI